MRTTIIILMLFNPVFLLGQELDSLGIQNNATLNTQEVIFFNSTLQDKQDAFDFNGKRIAFISGITGNIIITKSEFFTKHIKPFLVKGSQPPIRLIQLTKEEKLKSSGFDAIILSPVKLFTDKHKKRIIEQLGKMNE